MRGNGIVHAKIYIVLRNHNLNCWLYFTESIFDTETVLKRFLCYVLFHFLAIKLKILVSFEANFVPF